MTELAKWDSFYVIVGSAAGALIGLQFVVMTLLAARPPVRSATAGAAFSTPTVVHFSVVLLLSALLRAPWEGTTPIFVLCGIIGVAGIVYALLTGIRMRAQNVYKPDFEDRLFHFLLPLAAYLIIAGSACAALPHEREALFGVGSGTLLLLFCSIHNAWDAVYYHVLVNHPRPDRNRLDDSP